ncbi:MAG TPA: rhodanese-like domain-containing protein, partial [Dyella sp.]
GDIDLAFDSLEDAIAAGFTVVDLREPDEIAREPLADVPSLGIPSAQVVARANELTSCRPLLVCARGQRSGYAARLLRANGFHEAYSLAGGLRALRNHSRSGVAPALLS